MPLAACERKPTAPEAPLTTASAPASLPSTRPAEANRWELTPAMRALAGAPAGRHTGLFIDRPDGAQLRLMSYNVNFDHIFPDVDVAGAEKFQRLVKTLDPDILCLQEIRDRTAEDVVALLNAACPLGPGQTWHARKGSWQVVASKYPLRAIADRFAPPAGIGADGRTLRDPAAALVDLPDERFAIDVCVLNHHFKCCGGVDNDPDRQKQADAVASWIRDARTPGGQVDLPARTGLIICGDLNLVGGPRPLQTLLSGDIADEAAFGPDLAPDWDGSELTDAHPLHNAVGPDDYTWRNDDATWDGVHYDPGRLDYLIYSDSVLTAVHKFVLNTTLMSDEELELAGLERYDVTFDQVGRDFDHLPLVVDFKPAGP